MNDDLPGVAPDGGAIEVVAHDDAWVAVDKPAGLPSVPGRTPELADCAWSRVARHVTDALVVHRLDMATSGVLLFARGPAVQRALSIAFATREVRKVYVAMVHGHVVEDEGRIDLPLAADWPRRPRQVVDHQHGKPSLTQWRVRSRFGVDAACGADHTTTPRTLLELEPLTGRTHQLRVHLAEFGHPIIGDALYGPALDGPCTLARRMLLHALSIELNHPITGQHMMLHTKEPSWMPTTTAPALTA